MTCSNLKRLVAITGLTGIAFSLSAWAQSPAFEVASIRRNPDGGLNTRIGVSGGRLTVLNASPKTLIRNAYGILSFQLAGEPRWLDTDMYDIVATTGSGEKISQDQLKPLLQTLLADRFQLKVHWEMREASVYALVLDKHGPKFKKSVELQEPGVNTQRGLGGARMRGTHEPVSTLASNLGNQLGRIVVDKTGLRGAFDWKLEWNPDTTGESSLPSLFTALREQLGLRLEAQKGSMETLVIDSIERPSEN